jgi:hypothetical protein
MRIGLLAAMTLVLAACGAAPPVALTPDQVPNAFLTLTSNRDRTVHIEWSGSTSGGDGNLPQDFSASVDLAGQDFAGSVKTDFGKPGAESTVEFARVNGHSYERGQGEGAWQPLPTEMSAVDPLRALSAADVEYVGAEMRDGQHVHYLRIHNFDSLVNGLVPGIFFGSDTMGGLIDQSSSTFDVWTDTAGQPVEASVDLEPGVVVFGGRKLTASYRFTNWNADIYIVEPSNVNVVQPPEPMP